MRLAMGSGIPAAIMVQPLRLAFAGGFSHGRLQARLAAPSPVTAKTCPQSLCSNLSVENRPRIVFSFAMDTSVVMRGPCAPNRCQIKRGRGTCCHRASSALDHVLGALRLHMVPPGNILIPQFRILADKLSQKAIAVRFVQDTHIDGMRFKKRDVALEI